LNVKKYKIPISILVVIFNEKNECLLLKRKDRENFWQSVTGSIEENESPYEAAKREVEEETGINTKIFHIQDWKMNNEYEIYCHWRDRYAPGITHNTEHIFGLEVPSDINIKLEPREHTDHVWAEAIKAKKIVFSWTNRLAIEKFCIFRNIGC